MKTCKICGNVINSRNKEFCSKTCSSRWKSNNAHFISKDDIYENYVLKNKTWIELANMFNCSSATIQKYIKKYGFKYHTKSEPNNENIVEQVDSSKSRRRWKCKCLCGDYFIVSTTAINQRKYLCCNKCLYEKQISSDLIINTRWNRYVSGAKDRNLEFSISKQYAIDIFNSQNGKCALSGVEIIFKPYYKKDRTQTTASLDRIDSSKGYIEGNVQWVHKKVNRLKNNMNEKEFLNWCFLIAKERYNNA